ncbi:M56 family metallopeptidase [Tenacibaculum sp. 190524A05c]|uniref:Bla regulator protein blaR1 n=1 Tax=Tenacibaculum platacis TaxID=3137852 RepID=A0ABP1ENI1_9FLAO
MLSYIIQVILFQTLFLAVYDLFLSKETFFTKNRFYLIFSVLISFVLPLIKLRSIQKSVPQDYTILLPEVVLSPQSVIEQQQWYQSINYLDVLFWVGVVVFSLLFVLKLFKIVQLLYSNKIQKKDGYKLIFLSNSTKAFSFFNYIFIGELIPQERRKKIIQHELVHAKQKHTLDLLFFELLKISMWFNPILWIFQKRISSVHEYLSDEIASKTVETKNYINSLLEQVFQVEKISFVNQFYKSSLIKKRIIMMTKERSKRVKQLKYLLLVPVLLSMLFYTACTDNEEPTTSPVKGTQKVFSDLNKEPHISEKDTYFDIYIGNELPKTKEYSIGELTAEEKKEFIEFQKEFKESISYISFKIFEGLNNRKLIVVSVQVGKSKVKYSGDFENVPFSMVDKVPAFINQGTSKEKFNKNMANFVQNNFDVKYASSLGLEPGKKRIFAQFKINEEGKVIDVKVRAPHPELKEYTRKMIEKLPLMIPGEKEGKVVKVGYTLPITFEIK